jgi:parvulin-like peptidyl-prolyl isomerase
MLDILRKGQRWVTALFVLGIGGVMVFFIGLGAPLQGSSPNTLVRVGPYQFGITEFERVRGQRESQYQEALGEGFDATTLRDTLDDITIRTLMDRAILAIEAESLGLTVSREEIERAILSGGGFRDAGGRFDRQAFENFTQYEYGNERNFLTEQTMIQLASKMLRLLNGFSQVSEAEAREIARRRLTELRIAFVVLDPSQQQAPLEIDEALVAGFLATRESEARALYDEHLDRYDVPERVHARHVLLRVEPGATPEREQEVRAAAEALLEEIRGGADLGGLRRGRRAGERGPRIPGARRRSGLLRAREDGPVLRGGGLRSRAGPGERGRSQRVRVPHHPGGGAPAGREPALRGGQGGAGPGGAGLRGGEHRDPRSGGEAGSQRRRRPQPGGRSLEQAARDRGLTLERSGWLRRRPDGFVPGLGAAQDLIATAFTLSAGESSDRIFEVGDKLALVQVLETKQADAEAVEARIEETREELLNEKRRAQIEAWLEARRTQLIASGELAVNQEAIRAGR